MIRIIGWSVVGLTCVFAIGWWVADWLKVKPADVQESLADSFNRHANVELLFSNFEYSCGVRVYGIVGDFEADTAVFGDVDQKAPNSIEGEAIAWINLGHLSYWDDKVAKVVLPAKDCFSTHQKENEGFRQAIFESENVKVFHNRRFTELLIWDPDQGLIFQMVGG